MCGMCCLGEIPCCVVVIWCVSPFVCFTDTKEHFRTLFPSVRPPTNDGIYHYSSIPCPPPIDAFSVPPPDMSGGPHPETTVLAATNNNNNKRLRRGCQEYNNNYHYNNKSSSSRQCHHHHHQHQQSMKRQYNNNPSSVITTTSCHDKPATTQHGAGAGASGSYRELFSWRVLFHEDDVPATIPREVVTRHKHHHHHHHHRRQGTAATTQDSQIPLNDLAGMLLEQINQAKATATSNHHQQRRQGGAA